MRKYTGIEILRILCACFIPLLHIGFSGDIISYVQQYISRLGVPFFFAISGLFLSLSMTRRSNKEAWFRYSKKIARLFLVWLLIYSPILIMNGVFSLKEVLFKTPAFLWYLGSMLVAAVPFCFINKRKGLYISAGILYLVGTLFGDTYSWLLGGMPLYESLFITTRNGVFFALPLMLAGEIVTKLKKKSIVALALSGGILISEITYVGNNIGPGIDRSMYLALPFFIVFAVRAVMDWNPAIKTTSLGGISSAIYLMQYGIITSGTSILGRVLPSGNFLNLAVYGLVILVPFFFYNSIKGTKLSNILF